MFNFIVVSLLSCVQLFCNPINCSLPGSSVHGITQARILEWADISFSRRSSAPRGQTCVSCIGRWILHRWATSGCYVASVVSDSFVTPWTAARQTPMSLGFSRQEYRSGLPFPPPGVFPTQGWKPPIKSPALAGGFFTTSLTWEENLNIQMLTH